jgi:[histone H3]-lysine27 N-trimethyltransferase EZH2
MLIFNLISVYHLMYYSAFVRMTIRVCGLLDAVLETLARYLERTADDIKVSLCSIDLLISCRLQVYLVIIFPIFTLICKIHIPVLQARFEILHGEKTEDSCKKVPEHDIKVEDLYCDKDLDAALDSFDNLFCRRCLVCSVISFHIFFPEICLLLNILCIIYYGYLC